MMSFEEVKKKILKTGLADMYIDSDKQVLHFILKDGETIDLYTSEEETSYAISNDWAFMQSEICFCAGDLT